MSHYFPSEWGVSDYFIMSVDEYMDKKEFTSFDMKGISKTEAAAIAKIDFKDTDFIANMLDHPHTYYMGQLIKKSGGLLWQFNAYDKTLEHRVRNVVVLGGDSLVRWSWIDISIKLPVYKFLAKTLNKLRRHKVEKEYREWEKFLHDMHKEKK
jgi:hypothetical protein